MSSPLPEWNTTALTLTNLGRTPALIPVSDGVIHVAGGGAAACLQGILTNDVERLAIGTAVHAAVLSAKGMIITTLWCHHDADGFTLVVPKAGVAPLTAQLARTMPPRLARVTDLSAEQRVAWLIGGGQPPTTGQLCQPVGPAPFEQFWLRPANETGAGEGSVERAILAPWHADALSLLGGWPIMGREIDERTLPQEVRFDELESVKYDKGCYVGQETVARLHFRGHANRTLRALIGTGEPPVDRTVSSSDSREVGRVTSLGVVDNAWLGACKLRREVVEGDSVQISGQAARVAAFPLSPLDVDGSKH